jgi:hypothetical protein
VRKALIISELFLLFYFILLLLHVFCKIYLIPNDTNFYSFLRIHFRLLWLLWLLLHVFKNSILYHFIPFFTYMIHYQKRNLTNLTTIKKEYLEILENYKKRIFRNFRSTKKIWEIWETYKKRIFRHFGQL